MAVSKWEERLKAARKDWNRARKNPVEEFPSIPEGTYIARLSGMQIRVSQPGNLGISSEFTILEGGESVGLQAFIWQGLESVESLPYTQQFLSRLGVDIGDLNISALEETIVQLLKQAPVVRISVKDRSDSDYPNVRLVKRVDGSEYDTDEAEDETEDADAEDDTDDEGKIEKGSWVSYEDSDGKVWPGVVLSLDGETASVEFDDDAGTEDHDISDLTLLEGDDADDGDDDGDEDADADAYTDTDDDEEDDDDDDEDEPEDRAPIKGDIVAFKPGGKKKEAEGKVVKVDVKRKIVEAKVGKSIHVVSFDDLEILELE